MFLIITTLSESTKGWTKKKKKSQKMTWSWMFSCPSRSVPGLLRGPRRRPRHQWHVSHQTRRDGQAAAGVVRTGNRQWWLDRHSDQERRISQLLQELGQLQGDDCSTPLSSALHLGTFWHSTVAARLLVYYIRTFKVSQSWKFPGAKKTKQLPCFQLL